MQSGHRQKLAGLIEWALIYIGLAPVTAWSNKASEKNIYATPPPLKTYLFSCFIVKTSRIKASKRHIKTLCKQMETYSPFVKPPDPRMLKLKL